jgi:hypothetical protein
MCESKYAHNLAFYIFSKYMATLAFQPDKLLLEVSNARANTSVITD